ncbi:MAG: hypothetical protein LKF36_13550 [Lactobacillus sp.]|nr:hypothetical protein [Lactobacillus sp.]
MLNIENDFKNYVLKNTKPENRAKMAQLLNTKKEHEDNADLTPMGVIDFITKFYALVKPEFRKSVDNIMDANGNIRTDNYYMFEDARFDAAIAS